MDILTTPDERFANLDGYDFEPHYLMSSDFEDGELRIHYLDEGSGPVILLLHGEPSWSYLYRKMIPPLVDAGFRCVAPDLVGFGRSDKPTKRTDYTYERHLGWMWCVVEHLGLSEVTMFGQDWGGLLGLRMAAEHPDTFARIVASNTFLPTGDYDIGDAFRAWRDYSQTTPELKVGEIVSRGCARGLTDAEIAAYDAPFPDESFKEGARHFPTLVPATPEDPACAANRKAWEVLSKWTKPVLTLWADSDPITAWADELMQKLIPGCADQPHATIKNSGHFIQEDAGAELAQLIANWLVR